MNWRRAEIVDRNTIHWSAPTSVSVPALRTREGNRTIQVVPAKVRSTTDDGPPVVLLPLYERVTHYHGMIRNQLLRIAAELRVRQRTFRVLIPGYARSTIPVMPTPRGPELPMLQHVEALTGHAPLFLDDLPAGTTFGRFAVAAAPTAEMESRALLGPCALEAAAPLMELRKRTRAHLGLPQGPAWSRDVRPVAVVLDRADRRCPVPEDAAWLDATLAGAGFDVEHIEPLAVEFALRIATFARAALFISVHGAGTANLMWQNAGAVAIELTTWEGRSAIYRNAAVLAGVHFFTSEAVEPPRREDWPTTYRDRANPAVQKAVRAGVDSGKPVAEWPVRNARLWISTSSPLRLDRSRLRLQIEEARSRLGLRDLLGPWGRSSQPADRWLTVPPGAK